MKNALPATPRGNPAKRLTIAAFISVLAFVLSATASAGPITVELTADASRPAVNDLFRATVAAEATNDTPAELARNVNRLIGEALKTARAYPAVKTQSGSSSTQPVYSKSGKIEAWRMRSELTLESADMAHLSELLGKLQLTLAVSGLSMQPSPETRKKAENEAIVDAIAAFKARARIVADSLGKPYTIKQLAITTSGRITPPMMRAAAKSMSYESAPMPIEAGDTQISVTASGQIELP
ncbi:SIMPL domain-containing protein [Propionivibrio limicola]|uniref:SIMPL domain-containing protein n=1 Tax=Propionivibrio limicola TaxID=167645 RepID=UPI00129140B0|nr:SIMPL domain-containing protein [Propionivibrio limicola]